MIKEIGARRCFVAQGKWTERASETIKQEDIRAIRLSEYAGWSDPSISFLEQLPKIEHLEIWSSKIKDISPLYFLQNLFSLSIDGIACKVDFGKMQSLKDVHIGHWKANLHDAVFSANKLRNLSLNYYSEDLSRIAQLPALENLALSYSKIETLAGMDKAHLLNRLSLARVHHLISLDG